MLKNILIFIVVAHGVGHVLFLIPLIGSVDWGQSSQSWLLGSDTLAKVLGSALWIIAVVGFSAAAFGMAAQSGWWRAAAIIASTVSIIGLALFWRNPASSSAYFAGFVDLAALFALLVAHWPSLELVGA